MIMMDFTVIDAATGAVKRYGQALDDQFQPQCGAGELIIHGRYPDNEFYWDGDAMVEIPPSPGGPHLRFDHASRTWVDPRTPAQLQALHRAAIEVERDRRITADIVYAGVTLQAGERDQQNVSDKLAEMHERQALGQPIPAQLRVWLDKDNQLHTFADDAAYLAWLGGFAVAMAERGTEAYAWSWARKGALTALGDDLEALRGFDPAAN